MYTHFVHMCDSGDEDDPGDLLVPAADPAGQPGNSEASRKGYRSDAHECTPPEIESSLELRLSKLWPKEGGNKVSFKLKCYD